MIKNFIVYALNGKILRTGTCFENDYQYQAQPGELILEGEADSKTQYVVNGRITDLPPKPEGAYQFNYETKSWEANLTLAAAVAITDRNTLLYESDWTQIPNAPLTPEQVEQWAVYRQALRDVPQQEGFPMNIVWPVAP